MTYTGKYKVTALSTSPSAVILSAFISVMLIQTPLTALTLLSTAAGQSQSQPRHRCTNSDACWPTPEIWNQFNTTLGGKLIRSFPSAAVCHRPRYNPNQCAVAKRSWLDSFWRTNQTGGYAVMVWEMGEAGRCFIDTPVEAGCDQGIGMSLFFPL